MSANETYPRTTTLLVIRHGESASNAGSYFGSQSDSPLTERGIAQARALAEALADRAIHAVYSSDLSRARDTVAPLALARDLAVRTTALLRERDVGELTGLSFERVRAEYPELWARMSARDPDAVPPGGESQHAVAERIGRFLRATLTEHPGETVAIGSHGGAIHHVLRQLVGIHDLSVPCWISVDNASVSRVDLTEVAAGVRTARLTYVNRVLPLDGAPPRL